MSTKQIHPLVVGYPRSGFTLLISVIVNVCSEAANIGFPPNRVLKAICDTAGMRVAERIEEVFRSRGIPDDVIYNFNFKQLVGGPKWIKGDDPDTACFRKYIGVKGQGDFTLITSHPRQVMDYYEIIHSHVSPAAWAAHPSYQNHVPFASVRHPAGTVASACFSLNALTSEYIQRFVPPEHDDDLLRQQLALYKLSDLNFFEALLTPFKSYVDEFMNCDDHYRIMRWEDLLMDPVSTIGTIARQLGADLSEAQATEIWRRMDHINLTGAHQHNLRQGRAKVDEWKEWLTNAHIDLLHDYGFGEFAERYGYGALEHLDEADYTPFQTRLAAAIRQGEPIREYSDEELFGFAFNKSNLNLDRFDFKRYSWRDHTQVERSSVDDDDLVFAVWDAAEAACGGFNRAMSHWIALGAEPTVSQQTDVLGVMSEELYDLFGDATEARQWRDSMRALVQEEAEQTIAPQPDSLFQRLRRRLTGAMG